MSCYGSSPYLNTNDPLSYIPSSYPHSLGPLLDLTSPSFDLTPASYHPLEDFIHPSSPFSPSFNDYDYISSSPKSARKNTWSEHPLRSVLFVHPDIPFMSEDEIARIFGVFGDVRKILQKNKDSIYVSYYDIRDSMGLVRHYSQTPLKNDFPEMHFTIPKIVGGGEEDDLNNQGTIVVFNLDAATTENEVRRIFGAFGEIKEIRETPNKKHHRFIEYYDVRHAENAMKALNRTEINGKRIKCEASRPGGARRSMVDRLSPSSQKRSFISASQNFNFDEILSGVEPRNTIMIANPPSPTAMNDIQSYLHGVGTLAIRDSPSGSIFVVANTREDVVKLVTLLDKKMWSLINHTFPPSVIKLSWSKTQGVDALEEILGPAMVANNGYAFGW